MIKSLKYWSPNNFEVSSYKYHLYERKNSTYNTSGSDNTGKCTYSYNELGFRGDSIYKNGYKVMSVGCSFTEGVGVNNDETWSSKLCKQISNSVDLNFGHNGRSNDYISRCLLTYYDLIKPDLVLIMYTEPHRREFYTANGGIEPFHVNKWGYFLEDENSIDEYNSLITLSNDEENFQNWFKNHLLIKYFLESKKCNWLWNGSFIEYDYMDEFRFDGNYKPFIDFGSEGHHPGPKTNEEYSINLYNHISNKYSFTKNKNNLNKLL